MEEYTYLIIGGGMTADAAARGIREIDTDGSIGILSAENDPPYDRPPLSKALWKGEQIEKIWRKTEELPNLTLHLSTKAIALDPVKKTVQDSNGTIYQYEKLLLATGGTPNHLPFEDPRIISYRTLDDYRRLREYVHPTAHIAVVGGGFIGSEMAAALAMNEVQATMIFPEEGIGGGKFPSDLALFLKEYYQKKGVTILSGQKVTHLESAGEKIRLRTDQNQTVDVDAVVVGIGIKPNTELAEQAGLKVNNGIIVDETLRTIDPYIFAAGDVAAFYNPALQKRIRVEHEDNANTMGKFAGKAMAGAQIQYTHLPFFYSDLFDFGYEAVGELHAQYDIVADWQDKFEKGVVYYLKDNRVRGVLLWNVWEKVDDARALIAEPGPFKASDLIGRIRD